jgi:hypothetical protein
MGYRDERIVEVDRREKQGCQRGRIDAVMRRWGKQGQEEIDRIETLGES